MPRTNFLTIYNTFAQDKLREQFDLGTSSSLYNIIHEIANAESGTSIDIATMKFKWNLEDFESPSTWTSPARLTTCELES